MGKFLRKPKLTTDLVAVMDISHSTLGVRTRAKTLALQKLQAAGTTATPPPDHHPQISYLQLRSRKLEKPPFQDSQCCNQQNPNPRLLRSSLVIRSGSGGSGSNYANVRDLEEEDVKANCGFGSDQDTSFGENNLDFDCRERGTRESTPCSFIRDSNDIITPGSHTRPAGRHASSRITQRIMPSTQEIEEFFARHAQEQQRLFSEKYNFDIMNEKPLQGRYEWVRVQP